MRYHITKKSANRKTGPIPVTTTSSESCPPSCPFIDSGCYANGGPLALHWKKLDKGERGLDWNDFIKEIRRLPEGQLWRHNQAGDLPGRGNAIDVRKTNILADANVGKRGFTYSHKPVLQEASQKIIQANRQAIKEANKAGFAINLSGNNPAHADRLYDLGIAPVTTVLPDTQKINLLTPKGRQIVVCPATIKKDVSCATCGLCAVIDRKIIVGFPAHGSQQKVASFIATEGIEV